MRLKLFLLSLLLLASAMIVVSPPLPVTTAQGNTPIPPLVPTPSPVSPELRPSLAAPQGGPLLIARLPFADTFDTADTWAPAGAWTFDAVAGYEGGGWSLEGFQRDLNSTLTYRPLLDLSGNMSAQLLFRQSGRLPTTDLIAVEISVNNGAVWVPVDQQIGVNTQGEWTQRVVDLTKYRGQVIRLRLNVSTGIQLVDNATTTGSYTIDNLSIQFVGVPDEAPRFDIIPLDESPRTLFGLHMVMGSSGDKVIDLARQLRATGWPLGTLKGTTGTQDTLNAVEQISPETVTVFRSLETKEGQVDCPDTFNDPVLEAQMWLDSVSPFWQQVNADYFELTNECHPPDEWLVPFSIESMRLATERGYCLLLLSFAGGNPEPEEYAALQPIYEYALENPCRPGRYHGMALHAYGLGSSTLLSESGIDLGFRHRLFYAQLLQALPEALYIPLYITEAGAGDGRDTMSLPCEDVVRDILQYSDQLQYDPYVRGFHLWNLGSLGGWFDVEPCMPLITNTLVSYYDAKPLPGEK